MEVAGGTEAKGSQAVGADVGEVTHLPPLGISVRDDLDRALTDGKGQVVIDFTSAEASATHARICAQRGVPLVIGSTGFTPALKSEVVECARRIPLVMTPNMSVGVNVMFRTAAQLAQILGDGFDVEIVEAHHRMKKDAPSGTALRLAEDIASATGRVSSSFRFARQGQLGERPSKEIGLQTLRGGDVVGEHTVFFFGEGERLELTHRATSRDQFARGAIRAARWLVSRPPGLYDMQDVLGLR
jgi:4-hydroxy-tetrahydrodipicolinate reductase